MKKLWLALGLLACLGLAPAQAQQSIVVPATTAQIAIIGTAASITKIVSGATDKSIYVTSVDLVPVSGSVVTFSYGSGTNCATGTTVITGTLTFGAGQTYSKGSGYGAVWVLPPAKDLCITITTQVAPGSLAYAQF